MLILHSPLVRAIHYLNPSTVIVGQAFTVTWLDPPGNPQQFGIGIPGGDGSSEDVDLENLTKVEPGNQKSGIITLVAPSTTGNFNFGAYPLSTPIEVLGMSDPILAVGKDDGSSPTPSQLDDASSSTTSSQSANTKQGGGNSNGGNANSYVTSNILKNCPDLDFRSWKSNPNRILILAVVFGILFITLLTVLLFFLYRRHRKRKQMFDNSSERSSYFDPNKYQKRSSKYSSWNETSLGPYDYISQMRAPTQPRRRAFIPSTLLSTGYSGDSHSSVTIRTEEMDDQKHRKPDGAELDMEIETSYSYSIPVLSRIQHTDAL
ncbi:hypothetical protein VKT23_007754 [Stygiomarasmius scandens]|uniref:Uncharacterized protein n=1 Tax=Marasmiellus scandens TaxID=2682957 RepID=A0ABR1JJ58_9AGAR